MADAKPQPAPIGGFIFAIVLISGLLSASAGTFTWTKLSSGNASGSWTNQSNWSGATLPTTTNDLADFSALDLTADSTVTLDGNQRIGGLTFGDSTNTSAGGWVIAAGTPGTSTLTLGGANPVITVNALGTGKAALISAVLAGTNGLVKSGTGFLRLSGANTFSGGTVLSGSDCHISLGNDRALGTGLITVGATAGASQVWFQAAGNRTLTNAFEIRTVRWIIDWNSAGGAAAGDLVINGPVLLNAGASGVRDIYCGMDLTLNGPVSVTPASNPFNKQGGSTLTLNSTNSFTGPTTINAGRLNVNGRLASYGLVTVNSGTTLGGTGVVVGAVSVIGGKVSPGTSGAGTLTVGGLTANSSATFELACGAPGASSNGLIKINGNLTLDGTLNLTDLGGFSSGVYTGMWYSGTLVNNGVNLAGVPYGKTAYVDTTTPNYVLVRVMSGQLWPASGEAVPMSLGEPLTFSWVEVSSAVAYDLFLGTSSNSVFAATTNTAAIYRGRTAALANSLTNLTPGTTYYWRVDGVNASGVPAKGQVYSFTTGAAMIDLMQDTWVATDALNRTLPGQAEAGPPRSGRPIGIFYFLWHTTNSLGSDGPRDVTKEIQRLGGYTDAHNPWADNPLWMTGGNARSWYWGEPEVGYYSNDDEWVIRRHIALLEAAGVDVLGFDTTNGHPEGHEPKYLKIMAVIRKMQLEGTPVHLKVFHYTHAGTGGSPATVTWLYEHFYKPGLYRDLWFSWQGKPLIIGYPAGVDGTDTPVSSEVQNFFTWRTGWAYVSGTLSNEWQWVDTPTPQNWGWNVRSDLPEQLPVTSGGWANGNLGRSHLNRVQPNYDNFHLPIGRTEGRGLLLAEQTYYGLKYDPLFLFVVGWNEWWAGAWDAPVYCYTRLLSDCTPAGGRYFVDNYNAEYSRDLEPMKGGYTDNYYYQMVSGNRLRKGVRQLPLASGEKTINILGSFADWAEVQPEFRDLPGDTIQRNWPTTFSNLPNLTDATGRNDFTLLKVARDAANIYFLAQCRSNITSYTGSNWMVLLLDTDRTRATGWEGYDFAANIGPRTATRTSLAKNVGTNWAWTTVQSDIAWKVTGNQLMLAVPRSVIGLTNEPLTFDFHWADNFQSNDISSFSLNGDSAPDRRFNYRFQSSADEPVVLRQDDFDSGKQFWWDESWTNRSKWSLTPSGSYSGSSAICALANGTNQSALITRLDTSGLESLRVSFHYKLTNVLDAQNLNIQFYAPTGWITIKDLGRDQYHPSGQAWGYDERQNVWLLFADACSKSGTNALFFHRNFAVRIDASGISTSSQSAMIDDFLITGVLAKTNNLPAPWQSADVCDQSDAGISGGAAWTNGCFALSGSGVDIWNSADAFRFLWQARSGDGYVSTRITSQSPSDVWAKAGVMIRDTLDPGARHAMMALTPSNGLIFVRRGVTSGSSASTTLAGSYPAPYWVRLVRSGNVFTGFSSVNGSDWTLIGATNIPGFSSNAFWGLAVTAHNIAETSTATFDNVNISQPPSIGSISDRLIIAGQTLVITNTVSDPDFPKQAMTWSLVSPISGASVSGSGVFNWRPTISQSPGTYPVVIRVEDGGNPSLSATQSFFVKVTRPPSPTLYGYYSADDQFYMTIFGPSGPDYLVYSSTNLSNWTLVLSTNSPSMPFSFSDSTSSTSTQRFYRIELQP